MGEMSRAWSGALLIALLAASTLPLEAQTPRAVAQRLTPSVVLIVMQDTNAQPLSMWSGFVVRDGIIATNLHVIKDAAAGYAKLPGQKDKLPIAGSVGIDAVHDLALLSVKGLKAEPLPLANSADIATGDEVYAVGNPLGLEGTFSAGIVSGIRNVGDEKLLQITAPISPGSSGGPVANAKGEVIGVSVATYRIGQNLNFAIPSNYVTDLLARPTQVAELKSATAPNPKIKSMLDELGGRITDGVDGISFTWDQFIQSGDYSFSLKSKLQTDVRNVICLVVFYDEIGTAIDVDLVQYPGALRAGLAKRVKSKVDESVEKLNTRIAVTDLMNHAPPRAPKGKVEFRVLYFQVGDSDQPARDDGAPGSRSHLPPPSAQPEGREQIAGDRAAVAVKLKEMEDRLADSVAKIAPAGNGPDLIESAIDGEFEGWTGETLFKLSNGQIWQQVTYSYTYHYAFNPKVMIVKVRGAYKMKVDGVETTIFVKQLR